MIFNECLKKTYSDILVVTVLTDKFSRATNWSVRFNGRSSNCSIWFFFAIFSENEIKLIKSIRILKKIDSNCLTSWSCHLERPSNVEIGVEYQIINVIVLFLLLLCTCEMYFAEPSRLEVWVITKIDHQFITTAYKKVNKHVKIGHQFQHSTTHPNDMIQIYDISTCLS